MDATSRVNERDEVTSKHRVEEIAISVAKSMGRCNNPFQTSRSKGSGCEEEIKVETSTEPTNIKKVYLTPDEERSLLNALKELALEGWKTGQGWKRSTHHKAAAKVRFAIEGSTVTAKNVENKMHSWGKQYRLLNEFSKLSGVAIDQETHAIIVDSDAIIANFQTLSNLDVDFMQAERVFTEQEQSLKEESKMQKTAKLKKDLQEHADLNLVDRLRLIYHFLAHKGYYYYWRTMNVEEHAEFIKVFNEGKLG